MSSLDTVQRFILSVFEAAGLCAIGAVEEGPLEGRRGDTQASVLALVEQNFSQRGLKITSWEPIRQSGCFALLIYAQSQAPKRLNLLELRRELAAALAKQNLQLRMQREDLFLAMHRL